MDFPAAPFGRSTRIQLGIIVLLLLAITLGVAALVSTAPSRNGTRPPAILIFMPAIAAPAILIAHVPFWVRAYRISGRSLEILRRAGTRQVELEGIVSVDPDPDAFKGALRLLGSSGFGGHYGWFRSKRLGRFRAWVSDPARSVVIRFRDHTVVVSPADPAGFTAALRERRRI